MQFGQPCSCSRGCCSSCLRVADCLPYRNLVSSGHDDLPSLPRRTRLHCSWWANCHLHGIAVCRQDYSELRMRGLQRWL